ncbi:MAG: 1-acyl-sn-glycerol-3-phosphate acyltransferase [Anaerolineae bacterium]|jgi:1-acyl-sn-glycerol-3-phosphate acyltransferase|nr:1-acyl-sn-glycerol-3-phosphate acyltransferase [Anaerolineae bacterium]
MALFNRRPVIAFTKNRPPEIGIFRHYFARFYFWLAGWQVTGDVPSDKKIVVIAVYHTSNWDGWNMIMASWIVRVPIRWMVKVEWTKMPILGALVRATGGIGIDRSASHNTVEWAINEFNTRDHLVLAIPPEGTRKKTSHWRTGFYWIADGVKAPMKIALLDYGKKQVNFSTPLIYTTGDIEADMEKIWGYMRESGFRGLHPEKQGDLKLRPSAVKHGEHAKSDD